MLPINDDLVEVVTDEEKQKEGKGIEARHKEVLAAQRRNFFAVQTQDSWASAQRIKSPASVWAKIEPALEEYNNQPYHQNAERVRFGKYDEFGDPIIEDGTYSGPTPDDD